MSKEFDARVNRYVDLLEDGKWKQSVREMSDDGMEWQDMKNFFATVNFYPSKEMLSFVADINASRKNEEALDGFFAKNI